MKPKKFLIILFTIIITIVFMGCTEKGPLNVKTELTGGISEEPGPFGFGTVSSTTTQDITITWDKVKGANSYIIYWQTEPGVSKNSGSPIKGVKSPYIHKNLSEGTRYYYVVTAIINGKESQESIEVSAIPGTGNFEFRLGP